METRGRIWFLTVLELLSVTGATGEWGFRVQEFEKSPGLFYVDEGTVNLYSTTWKTVIYINLREENIEIGSLWAYIDHVDKLCNSLEIKNWTGCGQFKNSVNDRFLHLETNTDILADIIGKDNGESRWRRGVLNFVGKISKMLFGMLDEDGQAYFVCGHNPTTLLF